MRILVAEDDAAIAEGLASALRGAGYAPECVASGAAADAALASREFDLVILDLGLPEVPGLEVLERLRAREAQAAKPRTPVLILTARDQLDDRVRGLDAGADDYLAKPFELDEVKARVRALARRGSGGKLIELGPLSFDPLARAARLNGEPLELSAHEALLLEILLRRSGKLVSKDQLATQFVAWGDEVSAGAADLYAQRLSKKLERSGLRLITVPGLGYSLEKPA
jgi:two-component system, OmpR family, response regulator